MSQHFWKELANPAVASENFSLVSKLAVTIEGRGNPREALVRLLVSEGRTKMRPLGLSLAMHQLPDTKHGKVSRNAGVGMQNYRMCLHT